MTLPRTVLATIALLSVMLAAGFRAVPAASQRASVVDELDGFIQEGIGLWDPPGFAVSVVKDGDVVFSKGYGVRKLGGSEAVDEHTLFAIGSTTKAMTAAALGMLVDEDKLGWDDNVIDHLPRFRLYDPVVTREITVRDLLTHRAGLPNADYLWYGRDNTLEQILARMRFVRPETSLRSGFTYQNVMYAAAGAVVSTVSGKSWEEFVEKRIFDPLGMSRSLPNAATLGSAYNVASPHDRVDGEIRVIENASVDSVAAAGSVWSSVSDMARWMRFLLEGTSESGARLLEEETHEELFRPQTIVDRDEFYPTQSLTQPKWTTYGLGWFQHDYDGRVLDFHTGSIDGMVAIHGLVRNERLGVFVLGNLDHVELRHAVMYRAIDLFTGREDGRNWSRELFDLYDELRKRAESEAVERERTRVEGTSPSRPLDRYTGTYVDRLYGSATVTKEGDTLRLSLGPGLQGELRHWHYDQFEVHWDAEWRGKVPVDFTIDRKGVVVAVSVGGGELTRVDAETQR
jgi:CubicO group peptidase (beta-lactamase class C family)